MWETFSGELLLTFLIAAVPVLELRGAIPFGAAHGLPLWAATAAAVLGNIVPVPFIILFVRRVFAWLRARSARLDGLVHKLETRARRHGPTIRKYRLLGLFILVAIPLPGTGAWTGSLVAAMFDIRLSRAFPTIAAGVAAAGVAMALLTGGVIHLAG